MTVTENGTMVVEPGLASRLALESGQPVQLCYQCGKCSSGCPMAGAMDYKPNEVMVLLQCGQLDAVLDSQAIWLCVGCETCGSRCPNGISIGRVMDVLREMGHGRALVDKARKIRLFHQEFLGSVRAHGRVHEPLMLARYKIKTGELFNDLNIGVRLFRKGKFHLLPARVRDRKKIRDIFRSAMARRPFTMDVAASADAPPPGVFADNSTTLKG
ncbi:4Fe-4S dicluster domain-containing protein [Desulfofundulus thermobenzoicus]|nr:4Fe-4S dicluster domain-containing protein [Desulfofundulus thermobenzoicus]